MGCSNLKLSGKTFGKWTVVKRAGSTKRGESLWKCICKCGTERLVRGKNLVTGDSMSCGCENKITHGMADTRPYRIWQSMKTRCTNMNQPNYERYGKRGITYDPQWEIFENFWADMKDSYTDSLTLERIDNYKGYSKENCRWATPHEQNRNMRSNIFIMYDGIKYCLSDLAILLGISRKKLYYHHAKGLRGNELIDKVFGNKINNPLR